MTQKIPRRELLAASLAAGVTLKSASLATTTQRDDSSAPSQELLELRVYRNETPEKQAGIVTFVERVLRPALARQGLDRIGSFLSTDATDRAVYVLIPYATPDAFIQQNDRLEKDAVYHEGAASHFALPKEDAPFLRIESRLMRAFAGMPKLVAPPRTSPTRIVELRIYESHNAHLARRKVEMFNEGELKIMEDVGLAPVFFGETLISNDAPNLTYMLSAESPEAHKEHWAAFMKHPEWERMKNLDRYKGTVSKILSITLTPTPGSLV